MSEISIEKYISEDVRNELSSAAVENIKSLIGERENIEKQFCALQEKHDSLEIDFEQRYYDLEQNCLKLQENYSGQVKKCEELSNTIKQYSDEGMATKNEVLQLREKYKSAESLVESLQSKVDCLLVEKQDLNQVLESRSQEVSYLTEENKRLSDSYKEAMNAKYEAQASFEKAKSSEDNFRFETNQVKNQLELLNMQVEKQSDDLMSKHDEIQRLRREKIFAASDVQKQLDKLKEEHESVTRKLDEANKLNKQYEAQVAKYIDKLRDADEYNNGLESHFQKEIANQTKLAELYQKANDDAESKNKNLLKAVAELQNMVSQAESEKQETEAKYFKLTAEFDLFKENSNCEIEKQKIELERSNELIEISRKSKELVEMSPSAEAISKHMRSGLTITELYSSYVDATTELDNQKAENHRLQKSLDQIIQEVQEKAPILRQQKQDYEKCLITNCDLTKKLDLAMVQSQKAKSTIESLQRANDHLKRQNDSLEQSKGDFCKQLQHLIRENTILKGGSVADDRSQTSVESITDESFSNDSDKVISLNLVKYTDIIDLQVKNTQLLAALRSISDEKEAEQEGKYRTKLESLEMKLKNAVEENDMYQDEMRKMKELLSKSERQNNMYRVLLDQREESSFVDDSRVDSSINDSVVSGGSKDTGASMVLSPNKMQQMHQATVAAAMSEEERKTLQGVIQELKAEVKQWKEETRNAEVKANERCFEYQKENSELRLQNSKLATASSSLSDKVSLQALNEKALQNELESFRKQVNAMSSTQAKMQSNIDVLNSDIRAAQEKYSTAYVQLQSLQSERSVWKNTEKHLIRERDRLLDDKRVQSNLMANIDSLKNALEFNANDQQIRYQKAIGTLQANLDVAQKKNRDLESEKRNGVKDNEARLKDMGEKLNSELEQNRKLTAELTKVKNDLATSEGQLQLKTSQLEQSGARGSKHGSQESMDADMSRNEDEDLANVSVNLERAESELQILRSQKKTLEQHLENYKHMCEVSEEKYNSDTAQYKEKITSLEKQLKDFSTSQKTQFQTIAKLENDNTKLREDLKNMVDNSDSSHSKIVRKCDDLESELSKSMSLNNGLKNEIENLKIQLEDKSENLSLLSQKLETSSQKLNEGTSQTANFEAQLHEKSKEVERLKSQTESMGIEIEGFKSQVEFNMNSYKSKETHMGTRIKDLEKQNQILLEEIDKLGSLVSKTKTSILDSSFNDSISGEIPENPPPGTENLIELIRHLRREKDIYLAKYEVNQGECERAKQKLEFTQKRVKELEGLLQEEEERHQKLYQAMSQQEELNKKNDQVLVLQDSNSFLRKESARLREELEAEKRHQREAEEAALKPLKDEIATLKMNADAHLSEVEIMTDEISKWKARNNELLERITKIDSEENKKVLAKAKELETKNVNLAAELKGLESRLFMMNKEKNDFMEKYKASSTEANLLRSAKNTLESEKGTLVKQLDTLKGQVATLEGKVTGSKGSVDELANLRARYKKLQEFAKSKVEIEKKLLKDTEELKGEIASLETQRTDLTKAKELIEKRLSETTVVSTQQATESNCDKCTVAEADNLDSKGRIESLLSEIKKAKLQLDESQKRSTLLEQALSKTAPGSSSEAASSLNELKYKSMLNQNELLKKELEIAKKDVALGEDRKKKTSEFLMKMKLMLEGKKTQIATLQKQVQTASSDMGKKEEEVKKKEEDIKKHQEDCDKLRHLCLTYENKIELLEGKVESLETFAKSKPREVRLGDDTPSSSQPTLAVPGQQRSDKSSERPHANIKPITSTRSSTRQAPAVVHVQPLQSIQSTESAVTEQQNTSNNASSTSPSMFGTTIGGSVPQSARVVPQVRTVGEISSVQTPPHAQEFAVHTNAASSTTLESANVDVNAISITPATPLVVEATNAATTAAFVIPISRTTINLPTSSSDRADTTAAIQPYHVHSASVSSSLGSGGSYVNVITPVAQVSPEQQQQQQEISSTYTTMGSSTPMISPFSTSANRGVSQRAGPSSDGGPADSSQFSSKRPRDTFTSSDEEQSSGKKARVLTTEDSDMIAGSSGSTNVQSHPQHQRSSGSENVHEVEPFISSSFGDSSQNDNISISLPEIPSAVYAAIATISSGDALESNAGEPGLSVVLGDNTVVNEVYDASHSARYEGLSSAPSGPYAETENLEGGEEESQDELVERQEAFDEGEREVEEEETEEECQVMDEMTGEEVSASDRNYQVQDIVDDEETEEEEETEEDENGEMVDQYHHHQLQPEEEDDDDDDDDVICLSDPEENEQEAQFASLEPEDMHSMHNVSGEHQHDLGDDLDQDEINAYDEEESSMQSAGHVDHMLGSAAESEVGIIVSAEQGRRLESSFAQQASSQIETYNIEAMESSSNAGQSALMGQQQQNSDSAVWTKSPDRMQLQQQQQTVNLETDSSAPQSPTADGTEGAVVTSSSHGVDTDVSDQPQLRSLENVARKSVRQGRPRLRRNLNNQMGSSGSPGKDPSASS